MRAAWNLLVINLLRAFAVLMLVCAIGTLLPGRVFAQEINFDQIDKFESLGTGTLHVGAPVVRCAMTLLLPHLRQRKRLTNWTTGASGLTPKRTRSPSAMTPRCRQLRQRTANTQRGLLTRSRIV